MINYSIAGTGEHGTITQKVPVGSRISWAMVESEVRKQLSGYAISSMMHYYGNEVSSAQEETYEYTVLVSLS